MTCVRKEVKNAPGAVATAKIEVFIGLSLTKKKYTVSMLQIYHKYASKVYLKYASSILEACFKYASSILQVCFVLTKELHLKHM